MILPVDQAVNDVIGELVVAQNLLQVFPLVPDDRRDTRWNIYKGTGNFVTRAVQRNPETEGERG